MCAYSNMMGDWWHQTWPHTPVPNPLTPSPNAIPWPTIVSDPALAAQMLEVLKRLDAIDKRLNNTDCKVEKEQKVKITRALKGIAKKKRKPTVANRGGVK
jgi:tetrahydromethanopterin S-methyltransferase subunit G